MKNRPFFSGISGGIKNVENISTENLIGKSGINTGNFIFVRALREVLGSSDDVYREQSYYQANLAKEKYDYIAISAANWVASNTDMSYLCELIESVDLPCLVVGLGGQVEHGGKAPKLKKGTERFLKLVSERSSYISVRGQHTQEILSEYGIHNTWNTGCPSLLGVGKGIKSVQKKGNIDFERVVLQGTRHGFSETIFAENKYNNINLELYRFAIENDLGLLLQSEIPDIYMKMDRQIDQGDYDKNINFLKKVYSQSELDIIRFLKNNALLFWDLEQWFSELGSYDYLIGTRIHGVISAIQAGIPATLIVHDERTTELAIRMNIPHVDAREINNIDFSFITESYEDCDFGLFNSNRLNYQMEFKKFFDANNVEIKLNLILE